MAKLISISLDVTKITKEKLFQGKKGKYLDLVVALNDEEDNYGNTVSAWEKCEKDEQKNYLGNGKVFWSNEGNTQQSGKASQAAAKINEAFPPNDEEDDLPF